jgi:branched-chain amino acid transport system substrate-binding protein
MKKILSLLSASALAVGVTVAVSPSAFAACGGDIKIYFQGAKTGPYAETGINEANGVMLAIEKYNAKGPKVAVEYDEIDTQASGAQSPALAQRVVDDECAVGVVGGMYSGETINAVPVYETGGVPVISPSATNPALTNKSPIFHRVVANDLVQGPALAGIAAALKSKLFVVDDATSYGKGLATIVKKSASKIIVGSDAVTEGTTNFSSVVTKVKNSKATAVFYGGYYPEAAIFVKALRDNPATKNVKFIAGDGVLDAEFIKLAKRNAEGAYLTAPGLDMKSAAPALYKEYKAKFKREPGLYTLEAYNSAYFFLEGIRKGNITRASLNNFIDESVVKGVGMTMSFAATGDSDKIIMNQYTIKKGKMVFVKKLPYFAERRLVKRVRRRLPPTSLN